MSLLPYDLSKHDRVQALLAAGRTPAYIAREEKVTRQAMYQYVRRWFGWSKQKKNDNKD